MRVLSVSAQDSGTETLREGQDSHILDHLLFGVRASSLKSVDRGYRVERVRLKDLWRRKKKDVQRASRNRAALTLDCEMGCSGEDREVWRVNDTRVR